MTRGRLALHAHFYQPPRRDPFSGAMPREPKAAPYHDWNERITAECYRPNAERGNFGRIGWNVGPTLTAWLAAEAPDVLGAIAAQDLGRNGIAQGYHHTILPLASARDRRTEIRWGMRDFEYRFGRRSTGFWLPETAVDLATLRDLAAEGVRWTILAPWQAGTDGDLEVRRPYRVVLGGGQAIEVFFFDAAASAAIGFDAAATADADRFAREHVVPRLATALRDGSSPLLLAATDGETYGHHRTFRDLFLERLTRSPEGSAADPRRFDSATLGEVLAAPPTTALPVMTVLERTSWSCHHGIARWTAECPDAPDGRWKGPLRAALDRLAAGIDAVSERLAHERDADLWSLRDHYVDAETGIVSAGRLAPDPLVRELLAAQASRLAMFASDAWFWGEPDRAETEHALLCAAHAARIVDRHGGTHLERLLVDDLASLRSPATGRDGAAIYRHALEAVGQPAEA
ncbi:MAG: hypothetical protein A2X23_08135 [Chloroflexi bacterium GWC2_73_18]|nr:MAG: hypothetical protein A2X23_08135 [Chloroflexi bacterium GWC2_73_18]